MDAQIVLIALVGLLVVLVVVVLVLVVRGQGGGRSSEILEKRMGDLRETLDRGLHQSAERVDKQLRSQLESSHKLVKDITEELSEIKSTGREMLSFTEQLQSLERALKNPLQRGVVGEYVLENVIANVLPPGAYETQYTFGNGVRADAVIFLQDEKKICIDAKFSLDNYFKLINGALDDPGPVAKQLRDDLKERIKETSKYILPAEGTLDYAFMFVPSEALYYDILTNKVGQSAEKNLLEYAFAEYKVIIVSPTTLLAYLQTVTMGLQSLKIEKHTQEIIKRAGLLQKHLEGYADAFTRVGKSLGTVVNHYNKAQGQYRLIDKDFLKLTEEGGEFVPELIERPLEEEE